MYISEFFLSVCVDVDILFHTISFLGIYFIIKNIQENVSKNETTFKWSRTDTFQVCCMKTRSNKWSLDLFLGSEFLMSMRDWGGTQKEEP